MRACPSLVLPVAAVSSEMYGLRFGDVEARSVSFGPYRY